MNETRESLKRDRDAMEQRAAIAWQQGRTRDYHDYAAEAERLGVRLDNLNAKLIAAGE